MTITTILTDIEGTTSSLTFVRDVLFPYARSRLRGFVATHEHDSTVGALLNDVRTLQKDATLSRDAVIDLLERFSDEDRKVTPLKALQGLIWADGYQTGAFRAHVYDDAVLWLRVWHARGLRLCVYSSGSIAAQKLFFGHTEVGNLTSLFSAYFDTTSGSKVEAPSYRTIATALAVEPQAVAFLSDSVPEIEAAQSAGMPSVWVNRSDSREAALPYPTVHSFGEIETWLRSLDHGQPESRKYHQ